MKMKSIGIVVLVLILLSPVFIWGVNHLNRRYRRHVVAKNLRALGMAQTVYSNNSDDEYVVQSGQASIETAEVNRAELQNAVLEPMVQKLAGGFQFTEGPAVDKEGNIYFTDIPNNRIHKWSMDGTLSIFIDNSGGANGLMFAKDSNLIACAGGTGKLVSINPQGKISVLADSYEGKPFNSPNDLWIDPEGGIYFTDPRYGSRENLPQDGEHVYYVSADRKKLIRVVSDMVRPNGVIGTPDGKTLYVADHGDNKTYVYTINPDQTLSNKRLFAEQGSDGMTLDENGNLYLTAKAVIVYNPSGELIKTIEVPETPSNVCFGGKNQNTLFITARTSIYSIDLKEMPMNKGN